MNELRDLSLRALKLREDIAATEDEWLDQHAGYQAASEELDAAHAAAAEVMKNSKAMAASHPRRQAVFKALKDAYPDARRQCQQAALAAQEAGEDKRKLRSVHGGYDVLSGHPTFGPFGPMCH